MHKASISDSQYTYEYAILSFSLKQRTAWLNAHTSYSLDNVRNLYNSGCNFQRYSLSGCRFHEKELILMKRILLALVLLMFVLTGVTALDQSLYLSMEVDSYDLRDIKDFSSIKDFESLETTLWPLAAYTYGDTDSTGIKGFAQLGLPYTVGDSLDTLFPYVYSETYYRFRLPEATSLMRTGLITQFGKDQTYDMTYLNVFGLFTF